MHSKYCILIIVLYLFTGCTRSDTNISEETAPRTFQDIEDDFRAFEFKPGVNYPMFNHMAMKMQDFIILRSFYLQPKIPK